MATVTLEFEKPVEQLELQLMEWENDKNRSQTEIQALRDQLETLKKDI